MGRNTDRGKVAYSWIFSDPAKAGPTLGVVVVVVVGAYDPKGVLVAKIMGIIFRRPLAGQGW